jgi:hypothetical protein
MISHKSIITTLVIFGITCLLIGSLFGILNKNVKEGFNEQVGNLCLDCYGKNFNQCLNCFNCGWAVDRNGNGTCIGGDVLGPYNYERVARWYSGDPFYRMQERNRDYKLSYGPMSANRVI